MKNLKLLLAVIVSLISLTTFSQTKEKTIDWLNLKLAECEIGKGRDPLSSLYRVVIKMNYSNKPVILVYMPSLELYYMVLPTDVQKVYTERAPAGNLNISFVCLERNVMSGNINTTTLEIVDSKFDNSFRLVLGCPDEEINRLKKGFEHLIILLGGKLQVDNLFK